MTDSVELTTPSLHATVGGHDLGGEILAIDLTVEPPMVTYQQRRLPLIEVSPNRGQRVLVRSFDLLASLLLIIALSPVLVAVWLLVRLGSPGPGIYCSKRIGHDGETFNAYKFRSMVVDAEEMLEQHLRSNDVDRAEYTRFHKLRDDPRVTGVGRVLRAWSLDELPQLLNVLRGDMSLVGPRPLLLSEAEEFGSTMATVLRVKPGVTGLWQVCGRSHLDINDRIMLDVEYAVSRTLRGDIMICLKTVWHLLTPARRGAY